LIFTASLFEGKEVGMKPSWKELSEQCPWTDWLLLSSAVKYSPRETWFLLKALVPQGHCDSKEIWILTSFEELHACDYCRMLGSHYS